MNISKLADEIKDYKIIGLGEATHGQLKLNEFRNKLIKKLILKHKFTVIVLEEQYSCALMLDKYIKNKDVSYLDGLDALPFLNTTFVKLLKWLNKYNKINNNKISIIGIDCQGSCPKYKSNSKTTKYVNTIIKKYNNLNSSSNNNIQTNYRDKSMYNIFMKQYLPYKKYLLLGHNGHIQKEAYCPEDKDCIKWLGNHLYSKFKSNYLAIGNTFYNGSYLGMNCDKNYDFQGVTINKVKILNDGIYKTNLLNKNTTIYDGGAVVSSKNPNSMFYDSQLNNRFDFLIVINNELPFTII